MGHRGKGKHSEAAEGEGQVRPVPVGPLEEDAARGALLLPGQLLQPGGQAGKLGGEGVQRRLIGRRAGQVGAGTGRRAPAQLGPADVVVRTALSGLGKQLLPAPGAEQQAGQQGPPVVHRRGPVRGEQLLNGPPRRAGHQGGVPPQGDDPLVHRVAGGAPAGVVPLLVGQQAPAAVAVRPGKAEIRPQGGEVVPGVAVRGAVHRVLQNLPQAGQGEGPPGAGGDALLRQGAGQAAEALPGQKQPEDGRGAAPLRGVGDQPAGGAGAAVHDHLRRPLRPEAGGGGAPQPPPRPGQQAHVVPDPLGDGLPLQLGEDAGNVHHGLAHGGGGVELLPDAEEGHPPPLQTPDEVGKVAHAAAHPVQPVAHQGLRPRPADVLQHPAELGALEILS